jgi:hypothetical protein
LKGAYVVPLFGGYVADTYFGRYMTTVWSVLIAMIGHIILVIAAVPGVIEHPHNSVTAFAIALIIMGIGSTSFPLPMEFIGFNLIVLSQLVASRLAFHLWLLSSTRSHHFA